MRSALKFSAELKTKKKGKKSMFFGIALLVIGALIIIQHTLGINIPIIRVLFGAFLVYLGIKIVFGSFGVHIGGRGHWSNLSTENETIFSNRDFQIKSENDGKLHTDYSNVFGSSNLDTTQFSLSELEKVIVVNNVFGQTRIKTDPKIPISVQSAVAFGSIIIRGNHLGAFGSQNFRTEGFRENETHLKLQLNSVFGEIIVE